MRAILLHHPMVESRRASESKRVRGDRTFITDSLLWQLAHSHDNDINLHEGSGLGSNHLLLGSLGDIFKPQWCPYKMVAKEFICPFHHVVGIGRRHHLWTMKRALIRHWIFWTYFSASRTVGNEFLLFMGYPVSSIFVVAAKCTKIELSRAWESASLFYLGGNWVYIHVMAYSELHCDLWHFWDENRLFVMEKFL